MQSNNRHLSGGRDVDGELVATAEPAEQIAADAPPSNRALDKYDDHQFVLYWQGVDFLEMSVPGTPARDLIEELERLKALAQSPLGEQQARALKVLGDRVLQVKDHGSGLFRYVIFDSDFYIKVRGSQESALPMAFVQVRAEHLARIGATNARNEALQICRLLGELSGEETISRIDLTVDFSTAVKFDSIARSAWITRAEYRQSHSVGDRFTGWSIGQKGPTAFRLYDKLFEVMTRSKKDYLFQLWSARGWFHGDPVWRAEFQLRRATLAEFGLRSCESVLDALPGLWVYLTEGWLRLAQPTEADENRARWPTHFVWSEIQRISWEGRQVSVAKIRKQLHAPLDKHIVRQATSLITTEMAKEGILDPTDAVESLRKKFDNHWLRQEEWEGASMLDVLRSKALIKERKFGTHQLSQQLGNFVAPLAQREPGEEG